MNHSLAAARLWWYLGPLALATLLTAVAAGGAPARQQELGTQALGGTSKTFTGVREDGSYSDPSVGRRVGVTPSVTIVESSSFDWSDAGVGAAGACGLVLLASGAVLISHNRGRAT